MLSLAGGTLKTLAASVGDKKVLVLSTEGHVVMLPPCGCKGSQR